MMGYINHHAIIVTAWDKERIKTAHAKAVEIFGSTCSDVVVSPLNDYASFFVAPDGSKEGWEESDAGDERRERFSDWLRITDHYLDAIEVYYGGDEPDIKGIRNLGEIEDEMP